jgi:hypothetical protein
MSFRLSGQVRGSWVVPGLVWWAFRGAVRGAAERVTKSDFGAMFSD